MFTKDSNSSDLKTVKEFAEAALKETRNDLYLGSLNAPPSSYYDKATDKYVTYPGLFSAERPEKYRSIDAIVDEKINDVLDSRLGRYAVAQLQKSLSRSMKKNKKPNDEEQYEIFKEVISPALGGNCAPLSLYALIKLIDLGYQGKVEIFEFIDLDHSFLVLNRPENSDPKNWKTWGKECIILEPWLNEVFSANQFGKFWKDKVRFLLSKKLPPDKMQQYMRDFPTHSLKTMKSSIGITDNDLRKLRKEDKEKEIRPNFLKSEDEYIKFKK